MSGPFPVSLAETACRLAFVEVLCAHPQWSLENILGQVRRDDARSMVLGSITIGELVARAHGRPSERIDVERLQRARAASGPAFDALVLEVIQEACGCVGASYVRARVGGPRWKLQASIRRLEESGAIKRTGATSSVRYHLLSRPRILRPPT